MIIKIPCRQCLAQSSKSPNFNIIYIMNTYVFPREIIITLSVVFLLMLSLTHISTEIPENVSQIKQTILILVIQTIWSRSVILMVLSSLGAISVGWPGDMNSTSHGESWLKKGQNTGACWHSLSSTLPSCLLCTPWCVPGCELRSALLSNSS